MENYTGKVLDGRYEILEIIGVGGMAVVYKAYDNIDDRTVAVKILKEEYLANEEFRRRFKNESKAIAVLNHPNIVRVYDVSYGERLQYIVMEYVEGITLKEYIEQQGRLDTRETVHFAMQILRALQHAHDNGIVHRDIKPQNILLLSNGNIKVTDFGIARFSNDQKTMTDSAIGSVHYISPEQARGDTIDDKTDIYAVGVVLYEMLTGRVPFEGDSSVSVAIMQLSKDPTPPHDLNPNIAPGIEYIIMHAMQKNIHDRYQSAAEMLLDIEEFKRNPGVKFRENYFVDKDPTRKIGNSGSFPAVSVPVITQSSSSEQTFEPETEEPEYNGRSAVIKGIIFATAALALIVLSAFYFGTTKLNGSKLTVPNFMGKNYALEISGNNDYRNFNLEIEYVQNSTYEDGIVISQSVRPGVKIDRRKNNITLSVSSTVEMVPVPDVVGNTYVEAKKILENRGFKVVATPETSSEVDFGTVIRMDPEGNSSAEEGSSITIFYASDQKLIPVPNLVGWDYETAKSLLESVGLVIDEIGSRYEDSEEKYGNIIDQDIPADQRVEAGSKIAVVMSNGNAPEEEPEMKTVNITISLPSKDSTGNITATLNGSLIIDKNVSLDGSSFSFPVEGSGENDALRVLVDSSLYYTAFIDFTQDSPKIKNPQYRSGNSISRASLPSVIGQSQKNATATLTAAGFGTIVIIPSETVDPMKDGVVLNQTPSASSINILGLGGVTTDTPIKIEVGKYIGDNDD